MVGIEMERLDVVEVGHANVTRLEDLRRGFVEVQGNHVVSQGVESGTQNWNGSRGGDSDDEGGCAKDLVVLAGGRRVDFVLREPNPL